MVASGLQEHLGSQFKERLLLNEPLSRHTTYRIGGAALALFQPLSSDEVAEALAYCHRTGTPWIVIGLGSNVLISDDGFPGLVIKIGGNLSGIDEGEEGESMWRVESGVPTPTLARKSAKAGLSGMHRMVGIPGAVGGGVATNAGAYGQAYSQVVDAVKVVDEDGTIRSVMQDQIDWRYRSGFSGGVVTEASISFGRADASALMDELGETLRLRKERTPFGTRCCGSVFKNPKPAERESSIDPNSAQTATAGQLIDAAGCKGFRVGSAEVSKLHANYIVNLGEGTAAEVLAVIEAVRGRVMGEFGVELELEVRIIE